MCRGRGFVLEMFSWKVANCMAVAQWKTYWWSCLNQETKVPGGFNVGCEGLGLWLLSSSCLFSRLRVVRCRVWAVRESPWSVLWHSSACDALSEVSGAVLAEQGRPAALLQYVAVTRHLEQRRMVHGSVRAPFLILFCFFLLTFLTCFIWGWAGERVSGIGSAALNK